MSVKLEHWANPEQILMAKLEADLDYRRKDIEPEWSACEKALEEEGGLIKTTAKQQVNPITGGGFAPGGEEIRTSVNYIFAHHRMLLSQMSANPPYAGARPLTSDEQDRDAAEAAEDVIRWWYQHANLQEIADLTCSKTLKYGTGWTKTIYNPNKGDMLDFNEETDEIIMEGDGDISSPSVWDIWVDSTAICYADVEHIWERVWGPYEYWTSIYSKPEQLEILRKLKIAEAKKAQEDGRDKEENRFPLYFYYEKGMARNAMKGRFAIMTRDGKLMEEVRPCPHFYRNPMTPDEKQACLVAKHKGMPLPRNPVVAVLPFHMLTDIDVDDRVYGRSFIYYEANSQDIISRIDNTQLDNIKAFGANKLVVQGAGDLEVESINNNQFEILKVSHAGQVYPLNTHNSLPDLSSLRAVLREAGDGAAGVNAAMSGTVERETSASALQMAAAQGNQVRRRIFNKFTGYTKSVNQSLLMISKETWTESKTLAVLGKNGQFKKRNVSMFDIDGGYDFFVSYGEQLSLDPAMRRQELMQLIPILQNAGAIKPHQIMELLKVNEVELLHNMSELGKTRAKHIFDTIRRTKKPMAIDKDWEDHDAILEFARHYFMTAEFLAESIEVQKLMKANMNERVKVIASQAPVAAPAAPMPGMPPV